MWILSYAINIAIGTLLIYLSIQIIDRGNYRNTLTNAFVTAIILSLAGGMPFLFLFGLVIWVLILINWYSIGFFKSFLCVFVYAVLYFFLNVFLVTALISGGLVYAKMTDPGLYSDYWDRVRYKWRTFAMNLPEPVRKTLGIVPKPDIESDMPMGKKVIIVFKNGRSIKARILMEGMKGFLLDIANGRSEVVIRKDAISYIKEQ